MREENQSSNLTKMKANLQKLLKKRWALPAIYLGLAAIVLSTVLWLQGSEEDVTQKNADVVVDQEEIQDVDAQYEDALPVTTTNEVIKMPVVDEEAVTVVGYFYDFNATEEEMQNALVLYDNTYYHSEGIDLAMESGEAFDVVAALSGTVIKAEKDALFGNVVHIEHDNELVTVYRSLEDLQVEAGQSVKQGDILGQAGRSLYNKEAGVHVHFAIHQDGVPVNPMNFLSQSATDEVDADETDEEEDKEADEDVDDEDEDETDETDEEDN